MTSRHVISATQNLCYKSLSSNTLCAMLAELVIAFSSLCCCHKQFQDQWQLFIDWGVNVQYSLECNFDLINDHTIRDCTPYSEPQLFRFLQTLARFKGPAKYSISCWQKAVIVNVTGNLGLNSCTFLRTGCAMC